MVQPTKCNKCDEFDDGDEFDDCAECKECKVDKYELQIIPPTNIGRDVVTWPK